MMESFRLLLTVLATASIVTVAKARAVNISNTWMLPEERFSVFYRYFRDRISWYEADAVCQFHHANLVTADSSGEYDAIRAYLKELDITDNVWIGLSKTTEKPNFAWTDFKPLSNEGHWQQSIPSGSDPLCVVMDPAADFLWKPLQCGGPEVASFICELPVPSWAMGPKGCLLTELPSLTVLYIPEHLALELTSDCGLDGTKRIACKGNADREEMLKQLTCNIPNVDYFDEKSTKPSITSNTASSLASEAVTDENSLSSKTTKPWIWTSNTIDMDYGMPTRHRRETEETLSPSSTKSTTDLSVDLKRSNSVWTEMISSSSEMPEVDTTSFSTDEELTTQNLNAATDLTDISDIVTASAEFKSSDPEETGEYPSAISQGQLFSIIENGTMYDIFELNETMTDDSRPSRNEETPRTTHNPTTEVNTKETATIFVKSDKYLKNYLTKKDIYKNTDPKKANFEKTKMKEKNKRGDKFLGEQVEMLPVLPDDFPILNRTFRKHLPDYEAPAATPPKEQIDPHLDVLNSNVTNHNNNSEIVPAKGKIIIELEDLGAALMPTATASAASENPLEPEPEAQPRPNRKRQLTRPQRRSYYPYFFSRVLG